MRQEIKAMTKPTGQATPT